MKRRLYMGPGKRNRGDRCIESAVVLRQRQVALQTLVLHGQGRVGPQRALRRIQSYPTFTSWVELSQKKLRGYRLYLLTYKFLHW